MLQTKVPPAEDLNPQEASEWLEALDQIIDEAGPDRAAFLLDRLTGRAGTFGAAPPYRTNTPYVKYRRRGGRRSRFPGRPLRSNAV